MSITYSGSADALTRAALQASVALPPDLSTFNQSESAKQAQQLLDATLSTNNTRANIQSDNVYKNTNLIATVNDGINANRYISTLISDERDRVSSANKSVRNEQFKLRHKLLAYDYLRNYYRMGRYMVVFTLLFSLCILFATALWRAKILSSVLFAIIVAILGLIFMVLSIMVSRYISNRVPMQWGKRVGYL